jgi:hypothetical protein
MQLKARPNTLVLKVSTASKTNRVDLAGVGAAAVAEAAEISRWTPLCQRPFDPALLRPFACPAQVRITGFAAWQKCFQTLS